MFSVGSWAHFGSLVVSLAMLGFGLTSAIMCVAKGWFERHWRGVAAGALLLFGPLMVVCEPARPAGAVQRHLPGLRPGAEVAAVRQLRALLAAVPGRRVLSRHRVPEGQRIFGRVYFADLAGSGLCGLLFLLAMYVLQPEDLIVAPLLLWLGGQRAVVRGARRSRAAIGDPGRSRSLLGRRRTTSLPAAARHPEARGVGLQGRRLRAQIPRQRSASTSAPRRSATSKIYSQLVPAFRAGPVRQRGLQPAEDAGERLSRHLHRRRRPERHHPRPAGGRRPRISATCR